ncbi:MAG TPA: hypothetical protein PLY87_21375, partial [Planctomycetaceae bacterium]|nr:hypothetical protein [Planctomycetaceae bacterium]
MARRSYNDRSSRPPEGQHSRRPQRTGTPQKSRADEDHSEPSAYPSAPASKELTSLMVRQRTQLGPAASESIPVVYARNRTRHP